MNITRVCLFDNFLSPRSQAHRYLGPVRLGKDWPGIVPAADSLYKYGKQSGQERFQTAVP